MGSNSQSTETNCKCESYLSIKTTPLGFGCISLVITWSLWKEKILRKSDDTKTHLDTCDSLSMDNTSRNYAVKLCYRGHVTLCLWVKARTPMTQNQWVAQLLPHAPALHTSLPSFECCVEFRQTSGVMNLPGIGDELLTSDTGQCCYLALETTDISEHRV